MREQLDGNTYIITAQTNYFPNGKWKIITKEKKVTEYTPPDYRMATICWFCEKNPADPSLSLKYPLEKNTLVKVYSKHRTYNIEKQTVVVPQCPYCKQLRDKSNSNWWIPTLLFFVLAGLFSYLLNAFTSIGPLGYCGVIVAAILIAGVFSALLSTQQEKKEGWTEADKQIIAKNPNDFPALKELKEAGWLDPVAADRNRRS